MSTQNIQPKSCVYNCNTQIYWNTATSEYWEVFSKKKHLCPNRVNKLPSVPNNTYAAVGPATTNTSNTKPTYYSKKPWSNTQQPKPKMSNSFELLTGPIETIQKKYEVLSDIVSEYQGKVHGSQSHVNGNNISLLVYYEVPDGKRDEVKQRFKNSIIVLTI